MTGLTPGRSCLPQLTTVSCSKGEPLTPGQASISHQYIFLGIVFVSEQSIIAAERERRMGLPPWESFIRNDGYILSSTD